MAIHPQGRDTILICQPHFGTCNGLTGWSSGQQQLSAVGSLRTVRSGAAYRACYA